MLNNLKTNQYKKLFVNKIMLFKNLYNICLIYMKIYNNWNNKKKSVAKRI